mmetsp:Transcript_18079/g.44821  ORF Transcript_18079/g.44821 Transcript_18079/m.44821 type:complete len:206 (+) Transcript_18079:2346-2963(+)
MVDFVVGHEEVRVLAVDVHVAHVLASGPDRGVVHVYVADGLCQVGGEAEELLALLVDPPHGLPGAGEELVALLRRPARHQARHGRPRQGLEHGDALVLLAPQSLQDSFAVSQPQLLLTLAPDQRQHHHAAALGLRRLGHVRARERQRHPAVPALWDLHRALDKPLLSRHPLPAQQHEHAPFWKCLPYARPRTCTGLRGAALRCDA